MRRKIMKFDNMGADPLASTQFDAILEIQDARTHLITSKDALNPWLLSDDEYGTVELFFVILYYNGLVYPTELVEGMEIRIPSKTLVMRALQNRRKPAGVRIAAI